MTLLTNKYDYILHLAIQKAPYPLSCETPICNDPREPQSAKIEKECSNMKTLKEAQFEQLEQQVAENGIEKVRKKYESGDLAMLQVGVLIERSNSLPEQSSYGENRSVRRTNWNEEAETEQLAAYGLLMGKRRDLIEHHQIPLFERTKDG